MNERSRPRVLVVDDSDTARRTMGDLLQAAGYHVFDLPSAIGATRTILRNQIAAVVLDLSMPGLSGDKLVELLRKNSRLAKLVIVVVSGDSGQLRRLAATLPVNAVLGKSKIASRLVITLAHALAGGETQSQISEFPGG